MKSLRVYLICAAVVLTLYIVAEINRPKLIDWSETFGNTEKKPFGTYILFNRLKDLFPGSRITPFHQPVYNVLADDSVKNATYIIICPVIDLSKPDYDELVKYIKQGNDVFIAAEDFGRLLDKNLKISTQVDFNLRNESPTVRFVTKSLSPEKYYKVDKGATTIYFGKFDTLHTVVLGQNIRHKANFIKYSFGKGSLYLASNPKLFTNYSLLHPQGAEYAGNALSYLKDSNQLIWDEYYTRDITAEASPMRVFLKQPALAWAYYIAIFSLLAFVLFDIKRRQRIIPVIEPLKNSTLDFVNVVGRVYYEKRDNANIAAKKIFYLLSFVREQYNLKTNKLDNEFINVLAKKTSLKNAFISEMVDFINYLIVQQRISDQELIHLNQLIEKFYTQS